MKLLRTISKSFVLSLLSLLAVVVVGYAATTIGTDMLTTGTLGVTGLSTLGNATTTALTSSGPVWISGLASLNGNASTTMASLTGDLWIGGNATTTSAGQITTVGNISVATTTTTMTNEIAASSGSATTTMYLGSSSATQGGCIQLEASTGAVYRMYVQGASTNRATTTTGGAGFIAVFEPGVCK